MSESSEINTKGKPGRKPKVLDDPIAEAKRLKANESSRKSKKRIRDLEKSRAKSYMDMYGSSVNGNEDEYGIRPVDERRYIKCFKSAPIGTKPKLSYVKMMTGLSLMQISILQKRTGYLPEPAVKDNVAKYDDEKRWNEGSYLTA